VALAALFLLLGLLTGCGGGSSSTSVTSNGTPAGTYTLTVTGTSSSVVQAIQLTLTAKLGFAKVRQCQPA
jgi:predicted component of type VI protein secretion system